MKTVPSKWYNERVNDLAATCVIMANAHGTDSQMYHKFKSKYHGFKSKYKPSKDIKYGCISGAKAEILYNKNKIYYSNGIKNKYDPYVFLSYLTEKYYLCLKQTDRLMDYMDKLKLLY